MRRLYLLRPQSLLFRALRDLWGGRSRGTHLLVALCAMATDTVFRASATVIVRTSPGDNVASNDFAQAIEKEHPGVYAASSLKKASQNAYANQANSGGRHPHAESADRHRQG